MNMNDLELLALIVAVVACGVVLSLSFAWLVWYDRKQTRIVLGEADQWRKEASKWDVKSPDWTPPGWPKGDG